jgi:hypothetical protein
VVGTIVTMREQERRHECRRGGHKCFLAQKLGKEFIEDAGLALCF